MKNVSDTTSSVLSTIVRGESVEVELAGGRVVERVAWEQRGELVYLCTLETYGRLLRGEPAAQPIGFPLSDVRALA